MRCEEKEERTRKAWHVSTEKILEGDLLQRLHKGFLLLLGLLWLCFLGGGRGEVFCWFGFACFDPFKQRPLRHLFFPGDSV